MNCHNDFTLSEGLLETLAENGCDALPEEVRRRVLPPAATYPVHSLLETLGMPCSSERF